MPAPPSAASKRSLAVLALLALLLALPWGHLMAAGAVVNLQVENDLFGNGLDRHYTNGFRLNYLTREYQAPGWMRFLGDYLPGVDARCTDCGQRTSLSLGHNIYTPEDITTPTLIEDDRPYAGWLYGSIALMSRHGGPAAAGLSWERLDTYVLNLGVVGPSAQGDTLQKEWHELIDTRQPRGWDNQLRDELTVNAYHSRQWRHTAWKTIGLQADVMPHLGYALGNVHIMGGAGLTLRLGNSLRGDFGPPRIRPSLPGGGFFTLARDGVEWYLFGGVEGRVVARNIFLDGNTFRDSHSVDRKPLVADLQFGLVVTWESLRLSFTNVFRSDEFDGQQGDSQFGAISLSWSR
ncbi:MAG: lipid A deacylase LpxR family protein [Gammaproteobacteria bacterium]|nr:lipid A deacylase LpxR family protein [Gammaproteobacteria bacterium]